MEQVLDSVSSAELTEWMILSEEGYVLPDTYWQAGMIASVIATIWGKEKYKPSDFCPRPQKQQTKEEMREQLKAVLASRKMVSSKKRSRSR